MKTATMLDRFDPRDPKLAGRLDLPPTHSWPASPHCFDEASKWAIWAALAAERPLLVRGQAGIGKSQLARAVAHHLQVPFLYHVVNARCEPTDLLYTYDAVSRLAQAQVLAGASQARGWAEKLAEDRFVRPERLWWAFDWESARQQAKRACRNAKCSGMRACCVACGEPPLPPGNADWTPAQGCVVLIDEIDKAESDLPNALLESLGNTGFQIPLLGKVVSQQGSPPLVVVTTNEERELPAAFLRRCLVLQMSLGETNEARKTFLKQRARVHFPPAIINEDVLDEAVRQLLADREAQQSLGPARPGAAELLDLLKALAKLETKPQQREALSRTKALAFEKNKPPEEALS